MPTRSQVAVLLTLCGLAGCGGDTGGPVAAQKLQLTAEQGEAIRQFDAQVEQEESASKQAPSRAKKK